MLTSDDYFLVDKIETTERIISDNFTELVKSLV